MKAMLLAAGRGTRMGTVTDTLPKPLVPVAGQPMIEYAIENLQRAGVDRFVVNVHHLSELMRGFVAEKTVAGLVIEVSEEQSLLETGGGILRAKPYLDQDEHFFVHNADVFSEIELRAMWDNHVASGADVTLAVKKRPTSRGLLFSDTHKLVGWENTKEGIRRLAGGVDQEVSSSSFGFCGIHILSRRFFAHLETIGNERFSVIDAYLTGVAAGFSIRGFDIGDSPWFDIGTPAKLLAVEHYLSTRTDA